MWTRIPNYNNYFIRSDGCNLQTPTQDELREVPYYSHKQKLPKGVAEFVVTSRARRAINDGEDLQEIIDRILTINSSSTLYKKYTEQPVFEDNSYPEFSLPDNVLSFISEKIEEWTNY